MAALSASQALNLWERAAVESPPVRALVFLAAARPGLDRHAMEELSVGERDEALLQLRRALFGPRVTGVVECPHCGVNLDVEFSLDELRQALGGRRVAARSGAEIESGEWRISFRLPNCGDLTALTGARNVREARRVLLERCVIEAREGARPASPEELPEEVAERIAEEMAQLDPWADLRLAIKCGACGGEAETPFDIASYLWTEFEAWAGRMLREVHSLALAYGWSERDILAMGAARRRAYLALVTS
jgi:predicted RNA-binding Zn-ribbon protein involved in translation (DUF1610 family)